MTEEEERSIRYLAENGDWLYSRDVKLLLAMIDAAREECRLIYEGGGQTPEMAASNIGDKLGLHLND